MKITKYTIKQRLPDIDSYEQLPKQFLDYGRFGILQNDALWFGGIKSSHPNVKIGFYWAIDKDTLYISPRGCNYDWEKYITKDLLRWLLKRTKGSNI